MSEPNPFFAIVTRGEVMPDGEKRATIAWPKDRPLIVPATVAVMTKEQCTFLVDAAADLIKKADGTIITDAAGNKFRKVFAEDIDVLHASLKRLRGEAP